jgi:hypothetical protein
MRAKFSYKYKQKILELGQSELALDTRQLLRDRFLNQKKRI